MSQIMVSHLDFSYDGAAEPVFRDFSLTLETVWRTACTGRNGRGKTTLAKLIAGVLDARGAVTCPVPPVYCPFPVEDERLCALDAVRRDAPAWAVRREALLLGVADEVLARPFETLSGGERVKCLLASLFARDAAYVLLDEPTRWLDADGRRQVSEYLAKKRGFFVISHDRDFLDACCDHTLVCTVTGWELAQGTVSLWLEEKEKRNEAERTRNDKLRREAARLEQAARRTADWAGRAEAEKHQRVSGLRPDRGYLGARAARVMKRAKSAQARRNDALEQTRGLLRDVEEAEALCIRPLDPPRGGALLQVRDVSLRYGGTCVAQKISFSVSPGERIAVTGRNGCGKSTLLRRVCGETVEHGGEVRRAGGLVISCVPQMPGPVCPAELARETGDAPRYFAILRKLGFERSAFDARPDELSDGQRRKALVAKSLCERAHLYVWDEPLGGIDLTAREQLAVLIRDSGAAMLLVEHDRAFLRSVGARIVDITSC